MANCVMHITGYVASDIDVGTASNGSQVAKFSMPLESSEKGADGKYKPTNVWARITVWGAERVTRLLKNVQKGTHVHVYGRCKIAPYLAKTNDVKASVDITADDVAPLTFKKADSNMPSDANDANYANGNNGAAPRMTTGRAPASEPTIF